MATKVQKEWAEKFFKENPHIKELYLNKQGEFFTDKNYVENSLKKNKDGKLETYETLKRGIGKTTTNEEIQEENNTSLENEPKTEE